MLISFINRGVTWIKTLTPLLLVVFLLVAGVIFSIVGLTGELLTTDTASNQMSIFKFIRESGIQIIGAGVVGAIFRVVALINLSEEMIESFTLSEKSLESRKDLREVWLRVTRFFYLRGYDESNGNLAGEVEECLSKSLLRDGRSEKIFIWDIDQHFSFAWKKKNTDGTSIDGVGVVTERVEMRVAPLDSSTGGEFKTAYLPTSHSRTSDLSIEIKSFRFDSWDGPNVTYAQENTPNEILISTHIDGESLICIEREYVWNIKNDPVMLISWPYVSKNYRLTFESCEDDVNLFFVAESEFRDWRSESEKLNPRLLKQRCQGIILPSQSHTVFFQAVS